jgi:predicted phosphodiesterase
MTRIIIFGDLHANWEALFALQQAEPHPHAVLFLGDIVGYGPDPKRCLDVVRAGATHLIGSRHELAMAGQGQAAATEAARAGIDELLEATWAHTYSLLPGGDRAYLAGLPEELTVEMAGTRFHLTRLAPDDMETETHMLITMPQARLRELFGGVEADVILLGGPHVPALRQVDGRLIICPGSLGLPRYGVPDPTFAAWEDGRVQIHHLHYHPEDTIRKLSLLPLAPEHRLRLQSILRSGGLE